MSFVPILLLLKLNVSAETATIYSSYFLIIWFIAQIIEKYNFKQFAKEKLITKIDNYFTKIIQTIKQDYENIFYDVFFIFFAIFI